MKNIKDCYELIKKLYKKPYDNEEEQLEDMIKLGNLAIEVKYAIYLEKLKEK